MDEMENRELMDFETIHEKRSDELTELLDKRDMKQLQRRMEEMNEFDVAEFLTEIEDNRMPMVFRLLSKNQEKRQMENARFLALFRAVVLWFRRRKQTLQTDKEYYYFKCPTCSQMLRVPRGKGKISITCRNCGTVFQEKT